MSGTDICIFCARFPHREGRHKKDCLTRLPKEQREAAEREFLEGYGACQYEDRNGDAATRTKTNGGWAGKGYEMYDIVASRTTM